MNARPFIIILLSVVFLKMNAQTEECNLQKSKFSDFYTVDVEKTICIAQNSDKDITIFLTYAEYCVPCKEKIPKVMELSEKYNADFYLLLIGKEDDDFFNKKTLSAINSYNKLLKAVIITDLLYGENTLKYVYRKRLIELIGQRHSEKYREYLKQITPPKFENTNELSKFIVLNKKGEVLLVTSYNDPENISYDEKLIKVIETYRMKGNVPDNVN